MAPLNPNFKIYRKALLERVKMFNLLFLNLVPINTQNKRYKKITSETAVIKQNHQATLTKKTLIHMEKPIAKVCHFSILVKLKILGLLLFKPQFQLNNLKSKLLNQPIPIVFKIFI